MNNKIYIAGRVSGIKYETAKKNFSKYERYWRGNGYEGRGCRTGPGWR